MSTALQPGIQFARDARGHHSTAASGKSIFHAAPALADGQRVVFNVAPSTTTQSVVKNPALKAGFDGAHRFGIEVFEPATTNALMAALWVHDLRTAPPAFAHPLDALTHQANHGGLRRQGCLPRSALPLAALMGLMKW